MNKPAVLCTGWERTPWLLRQWPFRKADYRRRVFIAYGGNSDWQWQYAGESLPGLPAYDEY